MHDSRFSDTPLGRPTEFVSRYAPSLLCPIARERLREGLLPDPARLPFSGADLWTAWELTWLDRDGKPEVGVARLRVPCDSPAVFESKSLKLYLGSFSQTPFAGASDVARTLEKDLSATVGAPVAVDLLSLGEAQQAGIGAFTGACLDTLQIAVSDYRPDPDLLRTDPGRVVAGEALHSNLLHSLCPVTGQPDAGSIQVVYSGARIDHASLLRYIVSYREHQAFHEQCVERIFLDITAHCLPSELTVYARYNRRGGIDINPYRSTGKSLPAHMRLARQ